MVFVVVVAYYATVVAFRTGLDPDTYGIPVVSSSVDFVGAAHPSSSPSPSSGSRERAAQ